MSLSNRNVFNNENHFKTYFSLIDISGFNRFLSFFYWMVSSDSDEELLFNIPFTGNIKLKGLIIMGGSHGHHSSKVKLFKNRPHLTFDDAQSKSDQVYSFHLSKSDQGQFKNCVRTWGGQVVQKMVITGVSHGSNISTNPITITTIFPHWPMEQI